ncbi:hypothetical protein NK718_02860 [Alsobacter sp. SYSU M60028]|uniref:Integral membrane protein n=1 Tax=Alsobacter ponti TaxID=2962936 RepID=A0ABT1LB02_9HYPH|nr:hypothetical protein [Alsobacter ponti]MCP8937443.1 hypothetical protein [Alsobacter ponti]
MAGPQAPRVRHPSPHRGEVSGLAIAFAILAAPAVWALQVLLNYGLSSMACFPRDYPRTVLPAGWSWLPTLLAASTAVALVIAVAAAWAGYRSWRRTREEADGEHRRLLEVGEGRSRFLAAWGLWIGVLFAVAILFDAVGLALVTSCGG